MRETKSDYWSVMIFANLTESEKWPGVNYVSLPNVNDYQYPPQKKSFAALRHVAHNYSNRIEWYLRVDDDSMVLPHHLEPFLRRLNPDDVHFIGAPGFGKHKEDYVEEGLI